MVTYHTKINDQLKELVSKKGVNLPSSVNAKDQAPTTAYLNCQAVNSTANTCGTW